MTNILKFTSHPSIAGKVPALNKQHAVKHYQAMALEAVETNMHNMKDAELVKYCRTHSTHHPLVAELSFRLNRYVNLFKDAIEEQNK